MLWLLLVARVTRRLGTEKTYTAAAMGLSAEGTLTAALRELLLRAGNRPSKISALYDQLRSVEKFQRVTKTHIKDKIIRPMVLRGEVGVGRAGSILCR